MHLIIILLYNYVIIVRLGDDLLHHPSKAWLLFQEVIFTIIKEMKWLPHLNSTTQLLLLLRLKTLPELSG